MYPTLKLIPGKEPSVIFGHPWIFSGAIEKPTSPIPHGSFVHVLGYQDEILATGGYSTHGSISVRIFDYGQVEIDTAWFEESLYNCLVKRELMGYGKGTQTTGYRVVFGEADGIPGLVVDRFEDVVVFQIAIAALDQVRDNLIQAITNVLAPKVLIERSDSASRGEEGLEDVVAVHIGLDPGSVKFLENNISFFAEPLKGQKTGFFLDQKDLRKWILEHPTIFSGANVLNVFSYTGATGIAAAKSGASHVTNIDSSEFVLEGCQKNATANNISLELFETQKDDAFQFLGNAEEASYDVVIVDPPALIKSKRDSEEGKKAYHFLNRAAMKLVKDDGVLITSSCSHFLNEDDFQFLLRRGSVQSNTRLETLAMIRQAEDHPSSIYFPESGYLKSFCFQVRR